MEISPKIYLTRYGPNRPAAAIGEGDFWYGLFLAASEAAMTSTASEDRSDLRFEISDLNYLHINVHIAYMFLGPFCGL